MKKTSIFIAAFAACTAFFSCQKAEILKTDTGKALMSIEVSSIDTKTTNDGLSTHWAAGDQLTVWHASTGSGEYVKDGVQTTFSTTEAGASSTFSGSYTGELDAEASYDWYIVYPNKTDLVSPKGDTTGFVGYHNTGVRFPEQIGLSSSAHIAGTSYMMFGKAESVKGDVIPSVQMQHLSSLVKLSVKNSTTAAIRPHTIIFKGPEGETISGDHVVDLTVSPFVFTGKSGASYDFVWLNVKGAAAIEAGETADFYFTVKPFTAKAGDRISMNVNGYEKVIDLTSSVSFQSGMMKEIEFDYDDATDYSGTYLITGEVDGHVCMCEGRSYTNKEFDPTNNGNVKLAFGKEVRQEDGYKYVYYGEDLPIGTIDSTATIEDYYFNIAKVAEGEYAGMYTIQNKSNEYMSSAVSGKNNVTFQAAADVNSYWDIVVGEDGKAILCCTKSSNNRALKFNYNGGNYPRFIIAAYSNTSADVRLLDITKVKVIPDPIPGIVAKDISNVDGAGVTDASVELVFTNNKALAWEPSVDSFTGCVTAASITGTTLTYSVGKNSSTTDEATGTIVVKLSKMDQFVAATINVTQNPGSSSGNFDRYFVKVSKDTTDWSGEHYLLVSEQGNKAYVMYTDANYNDGSNAAPFHGCPSFEVALYSEGIGYTAATEAAGNIAIRKQSSDGTSTGTLLEGCYTFFLPAIPESSDALRQNEAGWGVWSRNITNVFMANCNPEHMKFQIHMSYENGSFHAWAPSKQNGDGYLRFDVTTKSFGWCKKSTDAAPWALGTFALGKVTIDAANVQLYVLEPEK